MYLKRISTVSLVDSIAPSARGGEVQLRKCSCHFLRCPLRRNSACSPQIKATICNSACHNGRAFNTPADVSIAMATTQPTSIPSLPCSHRLVGQEVTGILAGAQVSLCRMVRLVQLVAVTLCTCSVHLLVTPGVVYAEASLEHPSLRPSLQPPAFLTFRSPANGSRVYGADVELSYALLATTGAGRSLSSREVEALSRNTTICFELVGSGKSPACSPLTLTSVSIKGALPGSWYTIAATLNPTTRTRRRTRSKTSPDIPSVPNVSPDAGSWEEAGDALTIFVDESHEPPTAPCRGGTCSGSVDLRSAYIERVNR